MNTIEKAIARLGNMSSDTVQKPKIENNDSAVAFSQNTSSQHEKGFCHLDSEHLREQGYLTLDTQTSQLAEEYRTVKRPILQNAFGKNAHTIERSNLVMLTSALPGEGKTFSAINLALSIALEKDTTVLLVDSDVINPRLTRLHGLEDRPGLTDLLESTDCKLGDIIVNTNLPNFRILPAGKAHENSSELLASAEMERVAGELSERYKNRIVLFDAPPLLLTSQAKVLSNIVGQIIVVVSAGETPKKAITEVISAIGSSKVTGILLNNCSPKAARYQGGYSGTYGG